jgi:hypothetical protein
MRQTAYSRLKRNWKVAFSYERSDTLTEIHTGTFMRKSIFVLIFGLSLLTITSVLILPPLIDQVRTVPFSGEFFSAQATPSAISTSSFETQAAETPVQGRPPLSLTLILLALCCGFLLLIGIFILGFVVRNQNMKEWKKDKKSLSQ